MKHFLKPTFLIIAAAIVLAACGESDNGNIPSAPADIPVAAVSPPAPAHLTDASPIVISFNKSMDPAALTLNGTLMSDGGIWSNTNSATDTLTISPQTRWTEGPQSLILGAQSSEGVALVTFTLNYTIDATPPIATSVPASGSGIQSNTEIKVYFSETIEPDEFIASGTLWDESDKGLWSSTTNRNDTLTILPSTNWTDGLKDLDFEAFDLAGNKLTTHFEYTASTALPVAAVTPVSGGVLTLSMPVVIIFTESMDTTSLLASGSLWDESNNGVWTSTTKPNDTLTLSPVTTWSFIAQALILDANDVNTNSIATLNLTYIVGCATGLTNCSGTCVDILSDTNNCNACNTLCNAENAGNACTAGVCEILSCDTDYADCNLNAIDGCEINTTNNSSSCNACGASCDDGVTCTDDICIDSVCEKTLNPSLCADDISEWDRCGGFTSACDTTGMQSRSVIPKACTLSGCANGTSFDEFQSCSRSTDGRSCGVGFTCSAGACIPL